MVANAWYCACLSAPIVTLTADSPIHNKGLRGATKCAVNLRRNAARRRRSGEFAPRDSACTVSSKANDEAKDKGHHEEGDQ